MIADLAAAILVAIIFTPFVAVLIEQVRSIRRWHR